MKKLFFLLVFTAFLLSSKAQNGREQVLQDLEGQGAQQQEITATVKSSVRLFGERGDLTTVLTIIPKGSAVYVLDSDSDYYFVEYEEIQGYIFKNQAEINKPAPAKQVPADRQQAQQSRPVQQNQGNRFSYLEQKYGTSIAARISSGKIWKGMDGEMVKDSWGQPQSISRVISGNTVKEEWRYRSTVLHFRNNELVDWGPVR
jgi:uncharacterized protein YdbL (DUF1318 family)